MQIDGDWVPGPERDPDAQAPAGGVSASVTDVATWIRLQLNGGTLDGERIVSEEALVPTHTPQIVTPPAATYDGPAHTYGLGWNLDQDHLGYVRWAHSGAFTNGASTNVTLLPLEGLGVVVLTNGMPIGVPETIADQIIDQIVTGDQTRDWVAYWSEIFSHLVRRGPGPLRGAGPADAGPTARRLPRLVRQRLLRHVRGRRRRGRDGARPGTGPGDGAADPLGRRHVHVRREVPRCRTSEGRSRSRSAPTGWRRRSPSPTRTSARWSAGITERVVRPDQTTRPSGAGGGASLVGGGDGHRRRRGRFGVDGGGTG